MMIANCCPTPEEPPFRRSDQQSCTPMIRMSCVGATTGKTPRRGASLIHSSAEHKEQCRTCEGIFPAKIILPVKAAKPGKEVMEKDDRRPCHICTRKTDWFYWKSRRYLCMLPARGGEGQDKTRYADKFTMNVPKFDPDMKLNRDEDGTVVFQPEVA